MSGPNLAPIVRSAPAGDGMMRPSRFCVKCNTDRPTKGGRMLMPRSSGLFVCELHPKPEPKGLA